MKCGAKPKPTAMKILEGNPGKRPLPTAEPQGKPGLPKPPKHLTVEQRKVWKQLSADLDAAGIATNLDCMAFELLVKSYVHYLEACRKVAEFGPIWMEQGESKIPKFAYSPYWAVMHREWDKIRVMLTEFGMTPSSRVRVTSTKGADEGDPLLEMLKKRQSSN